MLDEERQDPSLSVAACTYVHGRNEGMTSCGQHNRGRLSPERFQTRNNPLSSRVRILKDIRLPQAQNAPSGSSKFLSSQAISCDIGSYLVNPVGGIVTTLQSRQPLGELSSVPEVPIAENHQSMFREYDVRTAWQIVDIDAIAQAACPQGPAEYDLASCICLLAGSAGGAASGERRGREAAKRRARARQSRSMTSAMQRLWRAYAGSYV